MSNPLFQGMKTSPVQNIMQLRNQMHQLRQNPQEIADVLKKSGRITDEQYKEIKGMNGDFSMIGQYLMGTAPKDMYGQIQNGVNAVQQQL